MAVMTCVLSTLYDLQAVAVGARCSADRPVKALSGTLALEGLPVGDEGAELEAVPSSVVGPSAVAAAAAAAAGNFAGSADVHQSMVEVAAILAAATLAAK